MLTPSPPLPVWPALLRPPPHNTHPPHPHTHTAPLLLASIQFAFQALLARATFGLGLVGRTAGERNWGDWGRLGEWAAARPGGPLGGVVAYGLRHACQQLCSYRLGVRRQATTSRVFFTVLTSCPPFKSTPGSHWPWVPAHCSHPKPAWRELLGMVAGCWLTPTHTPPLPPPPFPVPPVLPNGIITGMDIGFSNKSLVYITMSFYTMCKSTTPIFLLLWAFLWGLER